MPAYEVHGIREDGSVFGFEVFEKNIEPEYEADAHAYAVAEEYAKLWNAEVRLYKTPELNLTGVDSSDLWPGKLALITTVPKVRAEAAPKPIGAGEDVPF